MGQATVMNGLANIMITNRAHLITINSAIDVANQQITAGTQKAYTNNLMQVARIWRAYLLSEMSDNFGPMPIKWLSRARIRSL